MFDNLPPRLPATVVIEVDGLPFRLRYTEPATGVIGGKPMCADVWLFPLGATVYIPALEEVFRIVGKEGAVE
jgi:hypothetical protein